MLTKDIGKLVYLVLVIQLLNRDTCSDKLKNYLVLVFKTQFIKWTKDMMN